MDASVSFSNDCDLTDRLIAHYPFDVNLRMVASVNEVDNKKKLFIDVSSDKDQYLPGETLVLNVETKDIEGNAVVSDLSVRVTDASVLALKEDVKITKQVVYVN